MKSPKTHFNFYFCYNCGMGTLRSYAVISKMSTAVCIVKNLFVDRPNSFPGYIPEKDHRQYLNILESVILKGLKHRSTSTFCLFSSFPKSTKNFWGVVNPKRK